MKSPTLFSFALALFHHKSPWNESTYHGVQEKPLALIYAILPVISTILQVPFHLFRDLGAAGLFGTYHNRFRVTTFPHYSKEPPLSLYNQQLRDQLRTRALLSPVLS